MDHRLLNTILAVSDLDAPEFSPEFVAGLDAAGRFALLSTGMICDGKPFDTVWVETAEGMSEALVEINHASNAVIVYHPEQGPMPLSPDAVRRYLLDPDRFAKWAMYQLLAMPRSKKPVSIVPECIWDMGTPRLGKKTGIRVLLVRRFRDLQVRDKLAAEMQLWTSNERVAVVTTTAHVPDDLRIARVSVVVPLCALISKNQDLPDIDLDRLGMYVERGSANTLLPQGPVQCADDGSSLTIHGMKRSFRGGKKTVIRELYEAWKGGNPWVPEADLLRHAGYEEGTTLRDVFKDPRPQHKNAWREYLEIGQRCARLVVDAD